MAKTTPLTAQERVILFCTATRQRYEPTREAAMAAFAKSWRE
jgi:hypothetical protein